MKLCKLMIVFVAVVVAFPVIASAAELRVGVLNLNNVFDKYEKRAAMEEDFKDQRDREEDVLVEKQESLLNLREELQLLEQGSEARNELAAELEKKLLIL
ncbi:MAG: OmpH family outer membrane protein, partial [Planctomycetes bacterium]|nr:OmpH family outer membrane protein [Planctomycetota bacterium]